MLLDTDKHCRSRNLVVFSSSPMARELKNEANGVYKYKWKTFLSLSVFEPDSSVSQDFAPCTTLEHGSLIPP